MRVFRSQLKTGGTGLWSDQVRAVRTTHIDMHGYEPGDEFSELRVYFNLKDWDRQQHGLIYTDPTWIEELRADLVQAGYTPAAVCDIDYSEQGMQGDDYVSLDAGLAFIQSWFAQEIDDEDE